MTNAELQEILKQYPDDILVAIQGNFEPMMIDEVGCMQDSPTTYCLMIGYVHRKELWENESLQTND